MSLSASLSLGSATASVNQPIRCVLTITNTGASALNMLSIQPYAYRTGASVSEPYPIALGDLPLAAGTPASVPGSSGTLVLTFYVNPQKATSTGTVSIGCYCYAQDGSQFTPTEQTLTVYGLVKPGYASVSQSTLTAASGTVTNGGNTDVLTLQLKDESSTNLNYSGPNRCKIYIVPGSGTSTGSISQPIQNNGDGTFSAIFVAGAAGTALTIAATVDGKVLLTALPTITVT